MQVLSVFDMNVEKAACSIQCEALHPLYEFIFSEWTDVPATDMKKIKERLKKGGGEQERKVRVETYTSASPTAAAGQPSHADGGVQTAHHE